MIEKFYTMGDVDNYTSKLLSKHNNAIESSLRELESLCEYKSESWSDLMVFSLIKNYCGNKLKLAEEYDKLTGKPKHHYFSVSQLWHNLVKLEGKADVTSLYKHIILISLLDSYSVNTIKHFNNHLNFYRLSDLQHELVMKIRDGELNAASCILNTKGLGERQCAECNKYKDITEFKHGNKFCKNCLSKDKSTSSSGGPVIERQITAKVSDKSLTVCQNEMEDVINWLKSDDEAFENKVVVNSLKAVDLCDSIDNFILLTSELEYLSQIEEAELNEVKSKIKELEEHIKNIKESLYGSR